MKIRNKLLVSFGGLLLLMAAAFIAITIAMVHERSAKSALSSTLELSQATESVRDQMVANRLALSNYLLTGSNIELDKLTTGKDRVQKLLSDAGESKTASSDQRDELRKVAGIESEDFGHLADRFVQAHRDVDAGKMQANDLLTEYANSNPNDTLKRSNEAISQVEHEIDKAVTASREADNTASLVTISLATAFFFLALGVGTFVAFRTANEITEPLEHLIAVAREVGDKGDLDQGIDIETQDEIGTLAQTLRNMVVYFKEMATVSQAIAGGDLSVEVSPRSGRDTLASAFSQMTNGLRTLVRWVRDAASQVAAGSNQVADASEDSAKVNVQSSSAIDEVTSTMHEMSINVQNMVKNTQMQASSVAETSASIDQMVASIQRVADTAKVLLDISNRSRDEVQAGIGTMNKTTEGLNRINDSIGSSSNIIISRVSAPTASARSSRSSTTSPSRPICWRSTPPSKRPAPASMDSALQWSPKKFASSRKNPPSPPRRSATLSAAFRTKPATPCRTWRRAPP